MKFLTFMIPFSSLWLRFLAIFCLFVSSFSAYSQVDKKVYATEAFRSMPAYFDFLAQQKGFIQQLSTESQRQFRLIHNVLRESVQSELPGEYFEGYKRLSIDFSDNSEDFRLKPNQPIRSARTTKKREDPIVFNTKKLNRTQVSFLGVIQLLVHELGHKLGDQKHQEAVDDLATTIRSHLEPFFIEKLTSNGLKVQLLSLPFEVQNIGTIGDSDHRRPNIFVENKDSVQNIAYDLVGLFIGRYYFGHYTPHENGIGNFMLNRSFRIADVILGPPENPLYLQLVLETQNRLVYQDPNVQLVPGPVVGSSQALIPRVRHYDVIPPETHRVHVPIWAAYRFSDKLAFNFIPHYNIPWEYPPFYKSAFVRQAQKVSENQDELIYRIQLSGDDIQEVGTLALEVRDSKGHSYVAEGKSIDLTTFQFHISKSSLPDDGGYAGRLIVNSEFTLDLPEVLPLPRQPTHQGQKERLKASAISLISNEQPLPYSRSKIIKITDAPLQLNLSLNFEPLQVRLRWIKGAEIFLRNKDEEIVPIGRYSRVVEETFSSEDFKIIQSDELGFLLSLRSKEVHRPQIVPLVENKVLSQSDHGLRELKEVILTSKDGRSLHLNLSSNQKIFNREHLIVPVDNSCASSLIR